eukprot:3372362-Amphidinium_carterae.3
MERSFLEAKSELQAPVVQSWYSYLDGMESLGGLITQPTAEHDRHVEHFQQQLSELEEEKNFLAKELNDRKELAETEAPAAQIGSPMCVWEQRIPCRVHQVHTTKLEQEREVERRMFEDDRARLEACAWSDVKVD